MPSERRRLLTARRVFDLMDAVLRYPHAGIGKPEHLDPARAPLPIPTIPHS